MRTLNSISSLTNLENRAGFLVITVTYTSLVSVSDFSYDFHTKLSDTHFNRYVLAPLLIGGLKKAFNNLSLASKTKESTERLFVEIQEKLKEIEAGNLGFSDRMPKAGGSKSFSSPLIVYYLLNKAKPLTREDFLSLSHTNFNLEWIREAKSSSFINSYSKFAGKERFKIDYTNEILIIRGVLSRLKAEGRIARP